MAVQLAGDSRIVDGHERDYPANQGDAMPTKANLRHKASIETGPNRILSVATPPRMECPARDGTADSPGRGRRAVAATSTRSDGNGPAVRALF
jgi:hypothetical protein